MRARGNEAAADWYTDLAELNLRRQQSVLDSTVEVELANQRMEADILKANAMNTIEAAGLNARILAERLRREEWEIEQVMDAIYADEEMSINFNKWIIELEKAIDQGNAEMANQITGSIISAFGSMLGSFASMPLPGTK